MSETSPSVEKLEPVEDIGGAAQNAAPFNRFQPGPAGLRFAGRFDGEFDDVLGGAGRGRQGGW